MRKTQSRQKSSIIKTKKEDSEYAQFLQKKLQQQQYLAHLVNTDVKTLQQDNIELKKLVTKLRSDDKKSNKKITQLQQDKDKLQSIITKLQQQTDFLSKKVQRIQSQNQKQVNSTESVETKLVFKQFLSKTFPTYKDTIKRILRFFMYIEKYQQSGKQQRVKAYNEFVKSIVQKIMLFIFPKKTQQQNNKSIALSMVDKWRSSESQMQKQLRKQLAEMKTINSDYLSKIESYEAQLLRLRAAKNMLQSKVQMYQKSLKVKASQFVVHLKKALIKKTEYGEEDEAIEQMKEIMETLQKVVNNSGEHVNNNSGKETSYQMNKNRSNDQMALLSNKSLPDIDMTLNKQQSALQLKKTSSKKHPILKKNIYGYYEQPQLSTQWNFLTSTKHLQLNKQTQTLPDDLTILVTHPVIVVHLFDGDIRPQRIRHNTQFYVKIHKNSQGSICSPSIDSLDYKPIWNRQYIIKNYDFPSLRIELLNKSKGLRDKVIGQGKLTVQSSQSKIVNIRKQKQYQGRVRFGLHYPKGNIFQFVINSIQLIVPENTKILTQTVQISGQMNQTIVEKFSNGSLIKYQTNKSIIIIQSMQGSIQGRITNRKLGGNIEFSEFTDKQGCKKVIIQLQQQWQIILQGYIILIVSEQNQPQKIQYIVEQKYFAVRAGYPLISATYNQQTLYSHVKLPLVFNFINEFNLLQCVMESQKIQGKTQQTIIDPLLVKGTQNVIKTHQLLSTPPHIYQFFIQTLQGPQVKFSYQSTLFVKLPDKIKLQININSLNKIQNNNELDPMMRKGRRKLVEDEVDKIEFFIQTKDLMMNFYKILSKTYKVTGYSKYKLGYCKIKNLLTSQGQQTKRQLQLNVKKQILIDQPLKGEYYINICISKGYFPTLSSSTSKYAVQLITFENQLQCNVRTQFIKGQLLEWEHQMLIKFRFSKELSPEFIIKVIESPLIGSEKVVYECKVPMTSNLLKLGKLILNLNQQQVKQVQKQLSQKTSIVSQQLSLQQQNILILSNISIPVDIYSINVDRIQLQVQQQADWLSKIDPYIVFFINNKQAYKTTVQDGAGDNSQWNNICFKHIVTQSKQNNNYDKDKDKHKDKDQQNTMFQLRVYDQDLINDDYLGISNVIYDNQIADQNNIIECIRTKLIKQDKVCGTLKIHGKFKKIIQNPQNIISHSYQQLTPSTHSLFNICLTQININNKDNNNKVLQQGQKLKIYYESVNDYKFLSKQVIIRKDQQQQQLSIKNVNFSIYKIINNKQSSKQSKYSKIQIKLTTERKRFFKKQIIEIGSIILEQQAIKYLNKVSILSVPIIEQKQKVIIGSVMILIQPIYDMGYCVIDGYSSGTQLNLSSQKGNDSLTLLPTTYDNLDSLKQDFRDMYLFGQQYKLLKESTKQIEIKVEQKSGICLNNCQSLRQVYYSIENNKKYPLNKHCLTVYNIHGLLTQSPSKELVYNRQFILDDKYSPVNNKRVVKKLYIIKALHWQPIRFQSLKQHKIEIRFVNNGKCEIQRRQNENFNQYYLIDRQGSQLSMIKNIKDQNNNNNNNQQLNRNNKQLLIFSQQSIPLQLIIKQTDSKGKLNTFRISLKQQHSSQQQYNNNGFMIYKQKYTYYQNRGALYYQLQQYQHKYIRVYFTQLLVKINTKNIHQNSQHQPKSQQSSMKSSLQQYHQANVLKLTIQGSPLIYQSRQYIGNNGYYFQHLQFYLPTQNITNTLTLKLSSSNKNNNKNNQIKQSSSIPTIPLSLVQQQLIILLKGKINKYQYLYLNTQQYTLHTQFIIQSNISLNKQIIPIKPSIPTQVSFIELSSLQIRPSSNLHNSQLKIKLSLHNQFIQLKAKRLQQNNDDFVYEMQQKELLYIYQSYPCIVIRVQIIQQKIFGDCILGYGTMQIQKHQLQFGQRTLITQIKSINTNVILGRVQIKYKALSQVKYLYVDVDRVVPNKEYKDLRVQLIPFGGKEKKKTQRVNLKLSPLIYSNIDNNNNQYINGQLLSYDTHQDLIISEGDYQDYNVLVSNQQSKQLLGGFKLCDLIKRDNKDDQQHVQVLHPLRVTKLQLNGLIRVNYIQSISTKRIIHYQNNNNKQGDLVNINNKQSYVKILSKQFRFIQQQSSPLISIHINKQSGKLTTQQINCKPLKQQQLSQKPTNISLILNIKQKLTLFISRKINNQSVLVAFSNINLQQYIKEQRHLIIFQSYLQPTQVYALAKIHIKPINKKVMYQILEIKAKNLTNMQLLTKMNPYLVIQPINSNIQQNKQNKQLSNLSTFLSEVNQGKTNLWWKVGVIVEESLKITLYDKDIKFDDYIGQTTIFKEQLSKQFMQIKSNERVIKYCKLVSVQDGNKVSGQIQVTVRRIQVDGDNNKDKQIVQKQQQGDSLHCLLLSEWKGDQLLLTGIVDDNNSFINKGEQQSIQPSSYKIRSLRISLIDRTILYSINQPLLLNNQSTDYNITNSIANILKSAPILLKDFPFNINNHNTNDTLKVFIDLQLTNQQTIKTYRQTLILKYLLDDNKQSEKYNLKSYKGQLKPQHQQKSRENIILFNQCKLIPLINILNQYQPNTITKPQNIRINNVYTLDSLAIWLNYHTLSTNNIITIHIIITNNNNNNQQTRHYQINVNVNKPKLLKSKQTCILLDLNKSLKYQIYLQNHQHLQFIIQMNNKNQGEILKSNININNLQIQKQGNNNKKIPTQHQLLHSDSQINIGSLYLSLQKLNLTQKYNYLKLQQKVNKNSNQPILFRQLNININNKSSLSWVQLYLQSAIFYKDIEMFSKMDPYCIIQFNQFLLNIQNTQPIKQTYKSSVQQNIGTNPIWNEKVFFQYVNNQQMNNKGLQNMSRKQSIINKRLIMIKFMDEQIVKDRPIGWCTFQINKGIQQNKDVVKMQVKIYREQNSIQQVGIVKVSYKISQSYIIFLNIHSESLNENNLKLTIKRNSMKSDINKKDKILQGKQQDLHIMEPYPLSIQMSELQIMCEKQLRIIDCNELIVNNKSSGELWFGDNYVSLKYMIFH